VLVLTLNLSGRRGEWAERRAVLVRCAEHGGPTLEITGCERVSTSR
jgi:hypothetical protein